MIVGVDPGLSGAVAAMYQVGGRLVVYDVIDIPTVRNGKIRQIDAPALSDWLAKVGMSRVIIENVWPRPTDGVVPAFRFGVSVGVIHTVCSLYGNKVELVAPQVWKQHFALGQDKEASRQMALRLFPEMKRELGLKRHHNRAEAMLIARWAARPPIGRDW